MHIVIVGAGAIGGWMGARLARAGVDVSILARGATLSAIRERGLLLTEGGETISSEIRASADPSELKAADLVVISVKGPALLSASNAISALLSEKTAVLSAMNGIPWWFGRGLAGPIADKQLASVDPAGQLSATIAVDRVIGSVVHASCGVSEPGHVVHRNGNGLILGEPGGGVSDRLAATADAFRAAGFEIKASELIQQDIWYKLWGNQTINPISALTGATGDLILDDRLVADYALRIMAEAAAVGEAIGCHISETGEDRNAVTRKLGAFRTSMLQDVEAGRPLEIDALLSAPREIAARVGIATPNMDALHGLTRLFASVRGLSGTAVV